MNHLVIRGLGTYLPSEIRDNSWWPREIVAAWEEKIATALERGKGTQLGEELTPGSRAVAAAMARSFPDPFRGARLRRVLSPDLEPSSMEISAAKKALQDANISPNEIDFVLVQSSVPDNLGTSNVVLVHQALGLRPDVFCLSTEGMCQAALAHLVLAEQLLSSGRFGAGLLVQSSTLTRLMPTEDQTSPWFGDGASAFVVTTAKGPNGLLAHQHMTDASTYGSVIASVRDKRWHDDGRVVGYSKNQEAARRQFYEIPDIAKNLLEKALSAANESKANIKFWACHQALPWIPEVTKAHIGLDNAKTTTTFEQTGSLSGANLGFILDKARQEKLVVDGDLVALFSGAAGMSASAALLRWGT